MIELLAPAGDFETLQAAINAKADAVYFGIQGINMRAGSAKNFKKEELKEIITKLHKNNMKGYLTLNTIIYDKEINKVTENLWEFQEHQRSPIEAQCRFSPNMRSIWASYQVYVELACRTPRGSEAD